MIVPAFWAEANLRQRIGRRQITLRRFGWSDASLDEAQAHAQRRVSEDRERLLAGQNVHRRDLKTTYNGAQGLPIREEILARDGPVVVTRNLYGARCLNVPDVLFADVDFTRGPTPGMRWATVLALLAVAAGLRAASGSVGWGILAGIAALMLSSPLARCLTRLLPSPEAAAIARVERFSAKHPAWHLRIYRTPAGLRVLAMHRRFDPSEPDVADCFAALRVDRLYARMCRNQHCFRARLGPKPWRIGIASHLRPRPGVWPINPERLPDRVRWVEAYERAAQDYAACRFVKAIGSDTVDPQAEAVRALHDAACRAHAPLPIA